MKEYVRWGILGNAMIARDFMIPALADSETAKITGVASRGIWPDGAAPDAKRYASYEALLCDPAIDAVYVPVPNGLHAQWAARAMESGRHVLCEKPLAMDLSEVRALSDTAERTGRILMEAFMYRYGGAFREIMRLLDEGTLGRIRGMSCVNGYMLDWDSPARQVRALGGGCLYDIGCYVVDCMNAVAEKCGECFTDASAVFRMQDGVDYRADGWIRYGSISCSFSCWFDAPARQVLVITGEKGILAVTDPFEPGPSRFCLALGPEETEWETGDGTDQYRAEAEAFSRAVLTGNREELIPVSASCETARVMDALLSFRPA